MSWTVAVRFLKAQVLADTGAREAFEAARAESANANSLGAAFPVAIELSEAG